MERRPFGFTLPQFVKKKSTSSVEDHNVKSLNISVPDQTSDTSGAFVQTEYQPVPESSGDLDAIKNTQQQADFFQSQFSSPAPFPSRPSSPSSSSKATRFHFTPRRTKIKNTFSEISFEEKINHSSPSSHGSPRQFSVTPTTHSRFVGRSLSPSSTPAGNFFFTPKKKEEKQNAIADLSTERFSKHVAGYVDGSQQPTTPPCFASAGRSPIATLTPGFPFTPKRTNENSSGAGISANPSPSYVVARQRQSTTPSPFHEKNVFSRKAGRNDQPPVEMPGPVNESSEPLLGKVYESSDIDASERNNDDQIGTDFKEAPKSCPFVQENTSCKIQIDSIADQFLIAVDEARSELVAENENLKSRLSASEKQVAYLEEQIDKTTANQTAAVDRANDLLNDRETLRNEVRTLQEQISATENQLENKKRQCEMMNSQLEEKEQHLKTALDNANSLEELLRSSDVSLNALQIQLQLISTERTNVEEKGRQLSEQVTSLNEEIVSSQLKMSEAEKKFHSVLSDCQNKLEKETIAHENTVLELKDACANLESLKEEIKKIANEFEKMEAYSRAIDEEKRDLQERFNKLTDKNIDSEKSLDDALKNISLLESSYSTMHAQLQPLKQELEATSEELSNTREKTMSIHEENETLKSELEIIRARMKESEEKCQSDLADVESQLDCERVAHNETRARLELYQGRFEEEQKQHSNEQSRLQSMMEMANDQKAILEAQISELQNTLSSAVRSNESMREENLSLERQAELLTMDTSTLRVEALELSTRKKELQALLDDMRIKSALSENELRVDLCKLSKELDSQREAQQDTMLHLNDVRVQLCASKSAYNEAILIQNKLQSEITILRKNKLENEETIKNLENEINEQENNLDKMKADSLSLHHTLSAYEEFLKFTHHNYQLMSADYSDSIENVKAMTDDIKALRNKLENDKKNAAIAREDVHDLHVSLTKFIETKQVFEVEIQKRFVNACSELETSSEALKQANVEKSKLQSAFGVVTDDKDELERQIKALKVDLGAAKSIKEKVEMRLVNSNSELTASNHALQQLENVNLKVLAEKEELEKQIKTLKDTLQAKEYTTEKIQKRLSNANFELSATEQALQQANIEKSKFEHANRVATDEKEELEKQIQILKKDLQAAASVQETLQDVQKHLVIAHTDLTSINDALEKATAEKASLENTNRAMKSEKEELEKKFIALKDRLQNTEHTQEKFRIQNFALNDMVSSSNRQITDLQNRVNLLETEVTLANEGKNDIIKEKIILESQLGSLRQHLQMSEDKFNRELKILRHQLEVEKESQNLTLQNDIIRTNPKNSNESVTPNAAKICAVNDGIKKRSLVTHMEPIQTKVMKSDKNVAVAPSNASFLTTCDTLDENRLIELQVVDSLITGSDIVGKTNNGPFVPNQQLLTKQDEQQQLAAPLFVTRQKDFQEQPELETRKAFENSKASNSDKFGQYNNSIENRTKSDKGRATDKQDGKKALNTKDKEFTKTSHGTASSSDSSLKHITKKDQSRQTMVLADASFPIKLEHDENTSTKRPASNSKVGVSTGRERKKLFRISSPTITSCSPKLGPTVTHGTPSKRRAEEVDVLDITNGSSPLPPLFPVKKTYTRSKRVPMTSLITKPSPPSASAPKKSRRSTK